MNGSADNTAAALRFSRLHPLAKHTPLAMALLRLRVATALLVVIGPAAAAAAAAAAVAHAEAAAVPLPLYIPRDVAGEVGAGGAAEPPRSRGLNMGRRSSRWWFHTLNSSFTDQAVSLVRRHRDACTGVYLYMDTGNSTHSGPGRFIIGPGGVFSSATDAEIEARVKPFQALGVTTTVSLAPAMSSIFDGSAHNGIAAAVATAVRHNLTGLMIDYEPDDPKVPKATHELA
jgi:hypothetical protein